MDSDRRSVAFLQRELKLLVISLIIGLAAGVVVVIFRHLIYQVSGHMENLLGWARQGVGNGALFVGLFAVLGLFVGWCLRMEPMISGSGIPQVRGQLSGALTLNPWRILIFKFFGGLAAIGSGLTVGREGPSVQIGASIGDGLGRLFNAGPQEQRLHTVSGSAAGLAAAFNTPLSGLMFALEEMHHSIDPLAALTAITAALTGDAIAKFVFGLDPVLNLPAFAEVQTRGGFLLLVPLGIWVGLSGILFNKLIVWGKALYAKLNLAAPLRMLIPFVATAGFILIDPSLFGSGQPFIFAPADTNLALPQLMLTYAVKLLMLLIAFCSGMPGGIFFPLLILGSLAGNIFGTIGVELGLMSHMGILAFSILAMSAHFAAIVRSPITGILLIIEMTGSFSYFLPLAGVTMIAYLTAEFARSEPVYESLLHILLLDKRARDARTAVDADVTADPPAQLPD